MCFFPSFRFVDRAEFVRRGSGPARVLRLRLLAGGLGLLAAFQSVHAGTQGQALTASFQVASSWDAGYSATVVVTNSGGSAVAGWTGSLSTSGSLSSVWGVSTTGSGPYALTPASYNDPIPAYGQISFGYNGTGSAVAPTLSINGQNVAFGAPVTPSPTPAPTPGATPTPTPVAGAPGTPSVSIQQNWTTGVGFTVGWAIYSGGQATSWTLLQDGGVYATGAAAAGNAGGQTGSVPGPLDRPYSAHVYQIQVTNSAGSTLSAATPYIADGAQRDFHRRARCHHAGPAGDDSPQHADHLSALAGVGRYRQLPARHEQRHGHRLRGFRQHADRHRAPARARLPAHHGRDERRGPLAGGARPAGRRHDPRHARLPVAGQRQRGHHARPDDVAAIRSGRTQPPHGCPLHLSQRRPEQPLPELAHLDDRGRLPRHQLRAREPQAGHDPVLRLVQHRRSGRRLHDRHRRRAEPDVHARLLHGPEVLHR